MTTMVASLVEIVNALADQITDHVAAADLGGEALQVWPFLILEPTPPCVDIYPADPFCVAAGVRCYPRTRRLVHRPRPRGSPSTSTPPSSSCSR